MKRYCVMALIVAMGAISAYADSENDTIKVNPSQVRELVTDQTTNAKGKPVTRYYLIVDGELVQTSKKVAETYNLSKKHNAKCALAMVRNRKTGKKRIITN